MFAKFFIDRPVLCMVMSLLIVLAGAVSIFVLPIDRYPQIVPPSIQIRATYPGADAKTVAEAVAGPIEQELSGVDNLIYFSSQSSNDGRLTITATFEIGTNQDLAAVEVQNRLSAAEPRLPEAVMRQGITVTKASSNILAVVALRSDNPRYNELFLSNYAVINLIDTLRRIDGVGDASVFGASSYAMRIWVDPDQLAQMNMTVSEVAAAIREQNAVFPAGAIGERPNDDLIELTVSVLTQGRLDEPEQYREIVLKALPDGRVVRLGDVARVELGAESYNLIGRLNGQPTALILIYLQSDANALATIRAIRESLDLAAESFPPGVEHQISYDTTTFIEASIEEVVHTLVEAVILVLFVVFVFLQSWRATLIPLLAVPVAIIGAFAGMLLLGFSINTLTLFGLVLAIGIVVDDAIIVVENVERVMADEGLSVYDATVKAMNQVAGALIAIVLVLSAVFVPVAFMGGMTGQLYQQFAITIAVSVAISGLVALTLSPALCRLLLKPGHGRRKFILFRWFDAAFERLTRGYTTGVKLALRFALATLILFAGMGFITWRMQQRIPTGFLPQEDQGVFLSTAILPDGASLDRTDAFVRKIEEYLLAQPGVRNVTLLGGFDILSGGVNSTNAAAMFVTLAPFDERGEDQSVDAIVGRAMAAFADSTEGLYLAFNLPPIQGLGMRAGFELQLQSRGGGTLEDLSRVTNEFIAAAEARPELAGLQGSLRLNALQLFVTLDRLRTKVLGVNLDEVFDSLQAYLGSLYVNDFNKFGRVWRVQMQAEAEFRDEPSDIERIYVRNNQGMMAPLSGVANTDFRVGPNIVSRFNGFPAVQITGAPEEGYSTGQAMNAIREVAADVLPAGYGFEWSGSSYQEVKAGNQAPYILAFGLVVVFLVLAAQYERWSLPIAVLLSVPFAIFGALVAITLRGLVQDIYFQVGMLVLVGLSAKNSILIVEFCQSLRAEGKSIRMAAIEAARIRFRPIIMTSLAFIMGVVPLAFASGAGAAARHSIGSGVIGGMIVASFVAPFFVPVFYMVIQSTTEWLRRGDRFAAPVAAAETHDGVKD